MNPDNTPPESPVPPPPDEAFGAILRAAQQSAEEAARYAAAAATAGYEKDSGVEQPKKLSESYEIEIARNMAAHRLMRKIAFGVLGVFVLLTLLVEVCSAHHILTDPAFWKLARTSEADSNWHVLFFIGTIFVLITAIALSLAVALLKMISDRNDYDEGVKLPIAELIKTIIDAIKK